MFLIHVWHGLAYNLDVHRLTVVFVVVFGWSTIGQCCFWLSLGFVLFYVLGRVCYNPCFRGYVHRQLKFILYYLFVLAVMLQTFVNRCFCYYDGLAIIVGDVNFIASAV